MGAAGLTSSWAEMAGRGGVGVEIDLSRLPTREPGMTPYEILLSESQERMLVVAKADRVPQVQAIAAKWGPPPPRSAPAPATGWNAAPGARPSSARPPGRPREAKRPDTPPRPREAKRLSSSAPPSR